jgi:pyruvate dehydrogenase E2 component (dihydrolipoamide acetyltransferase)
MATDILLPALTPTMEEATLLSWLVKEGDKVAPGDVLAEIETDKTVVEMEAADEGIILQILVSEGTEQVKVDSIIAVMGAEGETASSTRLDAMDESQSFDKSATESKPEIDAEKVVEQQSDSQKQIMASPLARRSAAEAGIELARIKGTGPSGRILEIDVIEYIEGSRDPAEPGAIIEPTAESVEIPVGVPMEEVPLSNMRKLIAMRLQRSKQTVPHFYLTLDIELDQVLAMQSKLNARPDATRVTVNDFIIRAVARALRQVPEANVQYAGDKLIHFKRADLSVAVSIDGGLVTPVIRGADDKSLDEISREMRSLAESARTGQLLPEAYQGGTFTISNLGMHGIKQFDAVINAPQACILAVGQGEERATVRGGQVTIANIMTVTLSCDHRAIDGVVGSKFLALVKGLIQEPALMDLD